MLRGSFLHAAQTGYRYDMVRELRRLGAKHWTGSIGVHRREKRSGGEREGPTEGSWRRPPMRALRNKPDCFGEAFPRNIGGGGDQIGEEIETLPSSPVLDTTRCDGKLSKRLKRWE